jgi:PadR family transcriptional regulator
MKAEAQVLKGHLDTLLLASLANGPRHGYAVKEALREGSGAQFDLPTGTIYPALRRVEAAGLVKGTWSEAAATAAAPMNSP